MTATMHLPRELAFALPAAMPKIAPDNQIDSPYETKTVAAVERALSLLNAFQPGDVFLSLGELSERTGLYKSTILRLAQSLENHGYLERNEHEGFHIGPAVLRLAGFYQASLRPEEVIMPALQQLVQKTSESAAFQVPAGDRRLCVYRVDSPHRLRDYLRPGDTLPMDRGAAGKVMRAFTHPHDAAYAAFRKKVVLFTANETADGMAALAAPVLDASNQIFGAVVLSGAATRFDKSAVARFEPEVHAAAKRITAALGGDVDLIALPRKKK